MLSKAFADHFARAWIDAWNAHDIDRLLSHYLDDVEHSSPFVASIGGNPSGVLRGSPALGAYWRKALARFPDLRFDLLGVGIGASSITIRYRSVLDLIATEFLTFAPNEKVMRSASHYNETDLEAVKAEQPWFFAHSINPILNVSNIDESFAWFEKLGWRKCWQYSEHFGAVGSGECEIFLCRGGQGGRGKGDSAGTKDAHGQSADKGVWMSIWVSDVDAVHRRCLAQGIEVTWPPTDEEWGVREMHIRHPDGHVFRISKAIRGD